MPDLETRGTGSLQEDTEAYQAINAVLRGQAKQSHLQYRIGTRSLEERSISELRELAAYFAQQIRYANGKTINPVAGD